MSVFDNEHYSCPATFIWIFYNRQDPFWKGRLQQREQQTCLLEVGMQSRGGVCVCGGGGVRLGEGEGRFFRFLALSKQRTALSPGSQETESQNKPNQNKMTGKPSNLLSPPGKPSGRGLAPAADQNLPFSLPLNLLQNFLPRLCAGARMRAATFSPRPSALPRSQSALHRALPGFACNCQSSGTVVKVRANCCSPVQGTLQNPTQVFPILAFLFSFLSFSYFSLFLLSFFFFFPSFYLLLYFPSLPFPSLLFLCPLLFSPLNNLLPSHQNFS